MILSIFIGIPIGVYAATHQYSWKDHASIVLSLFFVSMPSFWFALIRVRIFALKLGWVPPLGGATDAAAFTQGGFRSGGITGLDHKLEDYYHTRRDTCDNMNPQGLADCYAISVKVLEKIENGAMDGR